jgi:hypothetical protein
MTMTKEIWRQNWLSSINELTSISLQTKSWLDLKNTNPHWSFVEFMCCYFDNLFSKYDYQYYIDNGWVSKHEYNIMKDWHEALDKYDSPANNDYDHNSILNDSKWLNIVKTGEIAKNALALTLNENEKQILTNEKNVA